VAFFGGFDGTRLAFHSTGTGEPVVCLPGGPMQASAYLGDLGGLSSSRTLAMPDLRGTGDSAVPADAATYRCDRQVEDVEALRLSLGLDAVDLLGHSAGGALAVADWDGIAPFTHGRWDAAARARRAAQVGRTNGDAAAVYYSAGAIDPDAVRGALGELAAPVLLLAGEYDVSLPPNRAAE
jgi:pimeloyl-ACP methyl ester carboxylesterase